MGEVTVRITGDERYLPRYQTELAAGADLFAAIEEPMTLGSLERALIPTGIRMELPPGYEGQVRPRSGLAIRSGLTLLNTPGTIDADYRGEVKAILINLATEPARITPGMRIAQLIVAPVSRGSFEIVAELSDSLRGEGGFGSTGS